MKYSVEVEIFGNSYVIQSEFEPEYTKKLAKFVDKKMKEVVGSSRTVSTTKVAVLTSMNIADSLFRLEQESSKDTVKKIEKKTEHLIRLIDEVGIS